MSVIATYSLEAPAITFHLRGFAVFVTLFRMESDPEAIVEAVWTAAGLFTFLVTWLFVLSTRY